MPDATDTPEPTPRTEYVLQQRASGGIWHDVRCSGSLGWLRRHRDELQRRSCLEWRIIQRETRDLVVDAPRVAKAAGEKAGERA